MGIDLTAIRVFMYVSIVCIYAANTEYKENKDDDNLDKYTVSLILSDVSIKYELVQILHNVF